MILSGRQNWIPNPTLVDSIVIKLGIRMEELKTHAQKNSFADFLALFGINSQEGIETNSESPTNTHINGVNMFLLMNNNKSYGLPGSCIHGENTLEIEVSLLGFMIQVINENELASPSHV